MFLLHKHKNHKHKINLNYNGATVEVFLLNSERGLWFCGMTAGAADSKILIRKFRITPSV